MKDVKENKYFSIFSVVVWLVAALGAFIYLNYYSTRAGAVGNLPQPERVKEFSSDAKSPVIMAFIHPKCKCSDATVDELSDLLMNIAPEKKPKVVTLFYYPSEKKADWVTETRLYKKVLEKKDWQIALDQGGVQAYTWGALTSGYIVYMDNQGEIKLHGGITESRGHRGESLGKIDLKKAILNSEVRNQETNVASFAEEPTFGCAMHSAAEFEELEGREKPKIANLNELGVNL
jgi:hypothetical protein